MLFTLLSTTMAADLSADVRYREEFSPTRPDGQDMQFRQRVRARVSLGGELGDLNAGLRIRTGDPTNPRSPYVDLGAAGLSSFPFALDRAYLAWAPMDGRLVLRGGKFGHPFADKTIYNELVWDDDVQGQGAAASIGAVSGDTLSWDLHGIAYAVGSTNLWDDGWVYGGQSALGFKGLTLGNAVWTYGDAVVIDNTLGGSVDLGDQPLALGARFVMNAGADADNIGWQAGVGLPMSVSDVGVKPWVDVHQMQANATAPDFVGDDHQVGADYLGVIGGVDVKPRDKLTVRAWCIADQPAGADWNTRFRLDFTAGF